ncbi:MAG TPA: tRNA (adenosine(37)-N6)-dimethylallyltransferase MiaA [Syntrophomonas sp.]|nr:tRNA (adenosine(37)-N6)-dimethylallyltransferase MiaA [Syntrophomonas sp.]
MLNVGAIVGPTAVGKTRLAIELAKILNGEILSCDSMQIYRGMDIGTAKANGEEQAQIPHHLIDIVNPDDDFTVADYQAQAQKIITQLNEQGKLPLLVGGTGLYYQAVVDDYNFFPMHARMTARQKWEDITDQQGLDYVYEKLRTLDSDYAEKISSNDRKRIIRALEVYDLTGRPFSEFQTRNTGKYNLVAIGLNLERSALYHKIEQRVDEMITQGLIDEVRELRSQGYAPELNSMQALGYKQVYCYLEGMLTYREMVQEIKKETRRYAKRQLTWFRKDSRITWINPQEYRDYNEMIKNISAYMAGQLGRM